MAVVRCLHLWDTQTRLDVIPCDTPQVTLLWRGPDWMISGGPGSPVSLWSPRERRLFREEPLCRGPSPAVLAAVRPPWRVGGCHAAAVLRGGLRDKCWLCRCILCPCPFLSRVALTSSPCPAPCPGHGTNNTT